VPGRTRIDPHAARVFLGSAGCRVDSTTVSSEPEVAHSEGGALAQRAPTELVEANPFQTGGAGLFDHSEHDAVSPSAGKWLGISCLVVALVVGGLLVAFNPAFTTGKAGGTPNQLGAPAGAGAGPALEPGSPAAEGAMLIASEPCGGCHTIPGIAGATGTVGPNLAGVASRAKIAGGAVDNHGADDLKAWILNPAGKKPGTLMPNVGLSDDQATKIAAFLETLK
jgi:cytochrome c